MAKFVVMSACKKFGLECSKARAKPMKRFSAEWGEYLDMRVREIIRSEAESAPTKGLTLYPPIRYNNIEEKK